MVGMPAVGWLTAQRLAYRVLPNVTVYFCYFN